jgi:uncharacterized protein
MSDPVLWFEVVGKNGAELKKFYSKLFGWNFTDAGDGSDYALVAAADGGIGGGVGSSQDGGDGHVTFFAEVDDPAAYLKKAEKLGGKVIVPPTEIPEYHLTFAYFTDPEGHVIGLSKGIRQQ